MAGNNSYGFDFLRAEHNLSSSNDLSSISAAAAYHRSESNIFSASNSSGVRIPDVSHKSNLEKQADILLFLKHHRSSGCLPPSVIYKSLGIDLSSSSSGATGDGGVGDDENDSNAPSSLVNMLLSNPKIKVEEIPDPENPNLTMYQFGYRAKFSMVHDKVTLLAQINRMKNGIKASELIDAYDGVEKDIQKLMTSGGVLGVCNPEEKDKILFPRGEVFLVELDGCVSLLEDVLAPAAAAALPLVPPTAKSEDTTTTNTATTTDPTHLAMNNKDLSNNNTATTTLQSQKLQASSSRYFLTDIDPQPQIRRGEAIRIGGEWFRVSSQIIPNVPLEKQPPRAQAPLSVVSLKDLSKKNEVEGYCYKFDGKTIPLDGILGEESFGRDNLIKAKLARERCIIASGGSVVGGGDGVGGSVGLAEVGVRSMTGGAAATLLSSFASEKSPSMLSGVFAKSVASSLGLGRTGIGTGESTSYGGGSRKLPTTKFHARRPGDHGSNSGRIGSASVVGRKAKGGGGGGNSFPMDADAVKAAVEYAKNAASDPSLSYIHAVRHGCTSDVRQMYLDTLSLIPTSESELHKALLEHKLIEPGEKLSRPRMKRKSNVDNDGKPQKRRYYERKNMRRTNTHLDGTEIGAMLARAAEKQARGKSVGDGGM